MPDIDLFDCFRILLGWIVTVYATVLTVQWAVSWYDTLAQPDKYLSILRRYLIVHGLRVRLRTFGGDVIMCLLLCVVFGMLWHAHNLIFNAESSLQDARRNDQHTIQWRTDDAGANAAQQ
jgi:hypothetical protein